MKKDISNIGEFVMKRISVSLIALVLSLIMLLCACTPVANDTSSKEMSENNSQTVSEESTVEESEAEESRVMITIKDSADYKNVALEKSYKRTSLYPNDNSPSYPDTSNKEMTDGKIPTTSASYSDGAYAGFNKNSEDYVLNGYSAVTVDLGELYYLDKFVSYTGSDAFTSVGISAPSMVMVYVSEDGVAWNKLGESKYECEDGSKLGKFVLETEYAVSGQYVQYRFVGNLNWMMIAEVEAYGIKGEESIPFYKTENEISFLFIGNSTTYYFNIPYEFLKITESAGVNTDVTLCTYGGAYLSQFADSTTTMGKLLKEKLAATKYDFIVLQDNGNADHSDSKPAMDKLIPMVEKNGAKPVLYKRYSSNDDPAQRPASALRHHKNYTQLAEDFNIDMNAPVADAFLICNQKYPSINLYHTDNSHHSAVGAYLSACVMAMTFLDIDEADITYNANLDPDVAAKLRECARIACETGYDFPEN